MITHVGTLLKEERRTQHLSLEDVSKATRIRLASLQALEEHDWDTLSSRTYAQGILKQYGKFLGLEEEKLIAYFRREYSHHEQVRFKKKAPQQSFVSHKRLAVILSAGSIFLLIGSFFAYQTYIYFKPPTITILSPTQSTFKRVDKVLLIGKAPKETLISVNGKTLYLDDKQTFQSYIPLTKPQNTVRIEAVGANGRKTIMQKSFTRSDL